MGRKKILYIHHGKGLGGAPLSLLYLIQALDKTKYHPVVLFLYDSEVIDLFKSKGIEVVGPLNVSDFSHTKIWWYKWYHPHIFLRSLIDSFKVIFSISGFWFEKINPDFIHLNTSSLWAWAKVAQKRNIPVVWHIREPLADGYFGVRKKIVTKLVRKYATKILPICKNDARPWKNDSKVEVVYNAVDSAVFDKNILPDDFLLKNNLLKHTPKILFLGGLSKEKGALEIFKIFEKLVTLLPDAKLLVAGYFDLNLRTFLHPKCYFPSSRYKIRVQKVLKKIEKSVIFLGPIKNVAQVMCASDVVLFPATVGHFARPIIEAGFMAKPVVSSNLSPLNELVVQGQTGFLLDIKNHAVWVEKLHSLVTNKKLNQKMGQNAFEFCSKHFDVGDQVVKVQNIYKELK